MARRKSPLKLTTSKGQTRDTRVTMSRWTTVSHIHRPWNDNTFRVTFSPPNFVQSWHWHQTLLGDIMATLGITSRETRCWRAAANNKNCQNWIIQSKMWWFFVCGLFGLFKVCPGFKQLIYKNHFLQWLFFSNYRKIFFWGHSGGRAFRDVDRPQPPSRSQRRAGGRGRSVSLLNNFKVQLIAWGHKIWLRVCRSGSTRSEPAPRLCS